MQHANEMFIKLSTMSGQNKTEIWADIFAAASNGFLLVGHNKNMETDKDIEEYLSEPLQEDLLEEPNDSEMVEDDDNGPKPCKR
jgi:hypothetical protein